MSEAREFSYFISGGTAALPDLAEEEAAEQWHEVSDGSLGDRRVLVRVARDDRDTLVCTGLLLGLDGEPITATDLRSVPLTAIIRDIDRCLTDTSDPQALMIQEFFGMTLAPAPAREPDRPRRGGEGPTDQNLRDFMRHLARAGGRNRRGAKATAARTYGIDRTTAYRWLTLADLRGITGQEDDR